MTVIGKAEPRFDIDLKYGREGEFLVSEYFKWLTDGSGKIEVKRKKYLDLDFYVETHCDKGRRGIFQPSGINVTTADVWAFVIGDTRMTILIPTEQLRVMVADPSSRDKSESDGNCPTKGKLISLAVVLHKYQRALEVANATDADIDWEIVRQDERNAGMARAR